MTVMSVAALRRDLAALVHTLEQPAVAPADPVPFPALEAPTTQVDPPAYVVQPDPAAAMLVPESGGAERVNLVIVCFVRDGDPDVVLERLEDMAIAVRQLLNSQRTPAGKAWWAGEVGAPATYNVGGLTLAGLAVQATHTRSIC